jgi:2-polyprenyl-6-methoxyphenol hydroxylase-like FAD-dependent oxidoreductase
VRPDRIVAAMPTHDACTLVLAAWPVAEMSSFRVDVEANYLRTLELAPGLAQRIAGGERVSRFHASGDLPGFFRRSHGPGWVLVGDAGYTTDPSTAQGITDSFHDAERVAQALGDVFVGRRRFEDALAEAETVRDRTVTPMYELTSELATLAPPPPELERILGASARNQAAMDAFASMFAGVLPVPDFFAPAHVASILSGATA